MSTISHYYTDRSLIMASVCDVATGSFVRVLREDGTTIVEGPCSLWGDSERVTLRVHPMTLGAWLAWELAPRETVAVDVAYGAPAFCESANVRGRVYLVDVDR